MSGGAVVREPTSGSVIKEYEIRGGQGLRIFYQVPSMSVGLTCRLSLISNRHMTITRTGTLVYLLYFWLGYTFCPTIYVNLCCYILLLH